MAALLGPTNRLVNTARVMLQPRTAMQGWLARYGDPMRFRAINGTSVVTANPALIRRVLATDPSAFDPFAPNAVAPLLGARSLMVIGGEAHKRDRRLLMPPLHGSAMRSYAEMMRDAARRHLAAAVGTHDVRAMDLGQRISLEVIIRAVFGARDQAQVDRFTRSIAEMMDSVSAIPIFVPALQREFFGHGPFARFMRRQRAMDALLREQIDAARRDPSGDDILTLMTQARYDDGTPMRDEQILDEMRTLLVGGHETTAISFAWAIDALHRNPTARQRLQVELGALPADVDAQALTKLPYLQLVIKEVLRLYPVVPEFFRVAKRPVPLGEHTVPKGDAIAIPITCVHRSAALYPDPDAFKPERFESRKYGPNEYLPFGGGHRRCIGAAFAEFELRIALAVAIAEFRFELLEPRTPREARRNITMAPKGGVPVRVAARDSRQRHDGVAGGRAVVR